MRYPPPSAYVVKKCIDEDTKFVKIVKYQIVKQNPRSSEDDLGRKTPYPPKIACNQAGENGIIALKTK